MSDNNIENVSRLSMLDELVSLSLGNNEIDDVTPLTGLSNLTFLDLSNNLLLVEIEELASLSGLTFLSLVGNEMLSCTALDTLESALMPGALQRPAMCEL